MTRAAALRTAIIGFGRISQGYAADPAMARYFPYASHAQVLRDHPAFDWVAVVDPDAAARQAARADWSIVSTAATVAELGALADSVEVAVLATPPHARLRLLDELRNLRAVLVEKPLGDNLADAGAFIAACERRRIVVQVNLWRRADERFRALATRELRELIGEPQHASAVYGNGLLNNGTHMVDFVRMLLGEVVSVQRLATSAPQVEGPIRGDSNFGFALGLASGISVTFQPVSFRSYRENGLVIWGERGRLDLFNEGLTLQHYAVADNRAMTGEREVACDAPVALSSTVGIALYHMYSNLAAALREEASLWSPAASAVATTRVVESIAMAPRSGELVAVGPAA